MVRHALPDKKKRQIASDFQAQWLAYAVDDYKEQLARKDLGLSFKGAKAVAKEWVAKCRKQERKVIKLNHSTIIRHAKGGRTRADANQDKNWATPEEAKGFIEYTTELGVRGWPLSHRRLKEVVDKVLRARLGPDFPGVGKRWTYRFVLNNSKKLATKLAAARESVRGGAVNSTTLTAWFDEVLGPQLEGVEEENIYGSDEHSSNGMEGQREHVIVGNKTKSRAHQQSGGSRENITVIATICADGTALPPTIIFKGKGYQLSWAFQENPLGASIGHSLRGWTTGEIGIAWIKEFDRLTKTKAAGRPRLLILDGHNSHYTHDFLAYARDHNIRVICYPAHTTHILQGLDVVVFGPLKRVLREERVKWEKINAKMSKNNFLGIYARAHIRVMTPETIKSAFRTTGVWPFDPTVIPSEYIAPSKETSSGPTMPLPPATPVCTVAKFIGDLMVLDDWRDVEDSWTDEEEGEEEDVVFTPGSDGVDGAADVPSTPTRSTPRIAHATPKTPIRHTSPTSPMRSPQRRVRVVDPAPTGHAPSRTSRHARAVIENAMERLGEPALERLVSSFAGDDVQFRTPLHIPPTAARGSAQPLSQRLHITPETDREVALHAALLSLEKENEHYRRLLIESQAVNVLNQLYNAQLKEKLAARDTKKASGPVKGRLMGDGMPVVLTGDEFFQRVVEYTEDQRRKAAAMEARKVSRAEHKKAIEEWKAAQAEQDEAWKKRRVQYKEEKAHWDAEKVKWAQKKKAGKVRGAFPMEMPRLGRPPAKIPRPMVADEPSDAVDSEGEEFEAVSSSSSSSEGEV